MDPVVNVIVQEYSPREARVDPQGKLSDICPDVGLDEKNPIPHDQHLLHNGKVFCAGWPGTIPGKPASEFFAQIAWDHKRMEKLTLDMKMAEERQRLNLQAFALLQIRGVFDGS